MEDSFFKFIGARTVSLEGGRCVQELVLRPEHLQRLGVLHGGIVSALVDDTLGKAMNALLDFEREIALTSQLNIAYLSSCSEGTVRVEGRILHHGRTTGYGEADVRLVVAGAEPRLIARGTALMIRKERRRAEG